MGGLGQVLTLGTIFPPDMPLRLSLEASFEARRDVCQKDAGPGEARAEASQEGLHAPEGLSHWRGPGRSCVDTSPLSVDSGGRGSLTMCRILCCLPLETVLLRGMGRAPRGLRGSKGWSARGGA